MAIAQSRDRSQSNGEIKQFVDCSKPPSPYRIVDDLAVANGAAVSDYRRRDGQSIEGAGGALQNIEHVCAHVGQRHRRAQ